MNEDFDRKQETTTDNSTKEFSDEISLKKVDEQIPEGAKSNITSASVDNATVDAEENINGDSGTIYNKTTDASEEDLDAAESDSSNKEKKDKKSSNKHYIVIIIVLLIALCSVGGYFGYTTFFAGGDTSAATIGKTSEDESKEDIIKRLNEETEKSRLWISAASIIKCKNDGVSCYCDDNKSILDNIEDNEDKNICYKILDENNEVIFKSEVLKPGESIYELTLDKKLDSGTHDVTVVAQRINEDGNASGGTVNATVQIEVA